MNSHVHVGLFVKGPRPNTFLAVHRSASDSLFPNMWALPGGKQEIDETEIEAVKRELWEETGLKLTSASRRPAIVSQLRQPGHFIRIHVYAGKVKLSALPAPQKKDVSSARWITPGTFINSLKSHHYPQQEIARIKYFLELKGFTV